MKDGVREKVLHNIVWGLLLALVLLFSAPTAVMSAENPRFSAEGAYEHVKVLAQKIGPRPAGSKAEIKAAQYIYSTLEQYGWQVRDQPFSKVVIQSTPIIQTESQIQLINSQNIIAELPGSKRDTIIIGAHYDSAGVNVPGAVDNGTGVGTLLELARVLSLTDHDYTYQLVFFGAEEAGLVGSEYFVSHADLSAVNWMLNIDMVGSPLEIDVAGKKSAPPELIDQVVKLAAEKGLPFHVSRDFTVLTRDSAQGGASDFSPFLEQGIPSVGLGIAGRPSGYYHRPEDSLEHVSLEELQRSGEYVQALVQDVHLEQTGPRLWDELYLTFQVGSKVVILPTIGLRIFYLLTFLFTILVFVRHYKRQALPSWRDYLWLFMVVVPVSLAAVGLSGLGELLWRQLKELETLWYAYPGVFLAVRVGLIMGIVLLLGSWFPRLPLPRDPSIYWMVGTIILFAASLLSSMVRVDLAFPFVFWLFCINIQAVKPHILLVFLGPYFLYSLHWELLNSQQWASFYATIEKYGLLFTIVYASLLIPLFLAALHVAAAQKERWHKTLLSLRRPILLFFVVLVLGLGLVPNYTSAYPQTVTVREEWQENDHGSVHIFSPERFPAGLQKSLPSSPGNSTYLPTVNEEAPFAATLSVAEREKDGRLLDVVWQLKYDREPYQIKIRLESAQPFQIVQMSEFIPIAKLPKKQQLIGSKQGGENYVLVMQRTPPQKNLIQMTIQTDSILKCTIEAVFAEPTPRLQISDENLSVDYQSWVQIPFEF